MRNFFVTLLLILLLSFWLGILYAVTMQYLKPPAPEQVNPIHTWSKRPICVVSGRPEFCKSSTSPRR